jgi:hypothetical protein
VYIDDSEFYLVDFKSKAINPFDMILATLEWLFKNCIEDPNTIIENKILGLKL